MSVESEKEELKREEQQRQLTRDAKAALTKYEPGIRLYRYLESYCYKYRQTMVAGEAYMTAYNNGMRDVILEIDRLITRVDEPPKQQTAINKET